MTKNLVVNYKYRVTVERLLTTQSEMIRCSWKVMFSDIILVK